jgi:hypothetical protein
MAASAQTGATIAQIVSFGGWGWVKVYNLSSLERPFRAQNGQLIFGFSMSTTGAGPETMNAVADFAVAFMNDVP